MRNSLPAEPNGFVGRERDVGDLCRLVDATRAVTLCGPGGIGKTRLALRVARALVAESPDGALLVELGEVTASPDPVARRLALALGLAGEPGRPHDEIIVDALRARRVLLVLDNCEHLIDDCARLCKLLLASCPGLRLLATSREPLRMPGENVWRVPPLASPATGVLTVPEMLDHEAVRLLVERAREVRPGFEVTSGNAAAVAEVCRSLDGVPLAIELAAARMRVLSVAELAARLADRFQLLSAGDRTAPPRQRTLRAAIDWSHDLLEEPERRLLRRLAVFTGWTLGQAEQVCRAEDLPEDDVLDLLTALVDKSLVVLDREWAGETRFRLPESVRQYALERLIEAGEEAELRRRHRDQILERLEYDAEVSFGDRPASWQVRVDLFVKYDHELDDVRAALAWSMRAGEFEEGLRLCTALRPYLVPRGHYAELTDWTTGFLRHSGEVSAGVRGAALVCQAQLAIEQRDFAGAEVHATMSTALSRAAEDDYMLAPGLDVLAQADIHAGRYEQAARRLDEELAVTRAEGDRWNEGMALITCGSLHARQGRLREAQQHYEAGLAVLAGIRQLWGVARALIGLGQVAAGRGDPGAARSRFAEALTILREVGALPEISRCLAGIGRVALDQGDLEAARASFTESLSLSQSIGMRLGVARGLEAFAALTALEGDAVRAVRLAGAAAALRDAAGQRPTTGARLERTLEPIRQRLGEPAVAQLWGEGRAMSADDAVASALETADPGGLTLYRVPVMAVSPPSTLTPREQEVARMIARGLSNKGVADELVISPATAARHVTNILTKLGFTSRAQIAAWVAESTT
ncbi:MAG TPA: LuxR C-terminal-related transcriptional regulator [Streptosporangiaceae bacterium]|nr:LuxR C-terminal-related transcriptional regulator [Streptosporangiaceae bacterium]